MKEELLEYGLVVVLDVVVAEVLPASELVHHVLVAAEAEVGHSGHI